MALLEEYRVGILIRVTDGTNTVVLQRYDYRSNLAKLIEQERAVFFDFYPEFNKTKTTFEG